MTPILQGIIRFCVTFRLRILKVSIRRSASRRTSSRFANRYRLLNRGRRHAPICPTADTHAAGLSSSEWRIYQFAADHVRYILSARRSSLASFCHWRRSGACSGQPNPIRESEVSSEIEGRRSSQPAGCNRRAAEHKTIKAGVRNPGSGPNKTLWLIAAATRKCHRRVPRP